MNKKKSKVSYKIIGCNVFLTLVIYMAVCAISNIYPFGTKSNMIWDLNIQYVDYFAYFKQVLTGDAHIGYSFLKSLGGNAVGIFGYYLASPLNLLVVFFKTENLQMFVFLLTAIKLILIAVTFNIYLNKRFAELEDVYVVIATTAFVFSQYMVGQMTNLMWLDGVYLLPVIMLGVYKFVRENKKGILFVSVAVSIIFNWYTGYMNCLFIPFYFLLEEALKEKEEGKVELKKVVGNGVRFCIIELCGVLASSILFLPVIYCLLQGKGQMEENIFQFVTNGSLLEILSGFSIGHTANNTQIILYCSEFIFLAVVLFFVNGKVKKYEKKYIGLMLAFLIAGCFFKPLENIWNGFRFAASYFYRFSYLATIMLIYTAVYGICRKENWKCEKIVKVVAGIIGIWLVEDLIQRTDAKYLWLSIGVMCIYGILFCCVKKKEKVYKMAVCALVLVEVILNGRYVMMTTYTKEAKDYSAYVVNEQERIAEIKKEDSSWYRMDETSKRAGIANVNESMVYNYYGIAHYSSAYDVRVSRFLTNMGYNTNVDVTTFDEPILPVDSLLGMKYLLSGESYEGYEKINSYATCNGKDVYENPYVLNIAIPVSESIAGEIEGDDSFEKINNLYSKILGRQVTIFKPVESSLEITDNGVAKITTKADNENNIVYGCASSDITDLLLSVDGEEKCTYNVWLSRHVFNIGSSKYDHVIEFENFVGGTEKNIQYKCYALDMDTFESVIKELKQNTVGKTEIEDGNVSLEYQCNEDGKVMLSVPYEKGWSATVNGKEVDIEEGAGTFIVLPVEKGTNEIVMKYHVPWLKAGVAVTVITVIGFAIFMQIEKRRKKSSK